MVPRIATENIASLVIR